MVGVVNFVNFSNVKISNYHSNTIKALNKKNTNFSIGNEVFDDKTLLMEELSFYVEEIFLFTYNLTFNVNYNRKKGQVVLDKRKNVFDLNCEILKVFNMDTFPILNYDNEITSDYPTRKINRILELNRWFNCSN